MLPHQTVGPADAPRAALVLHGILGSKTNWRTVIRRVAERCPGWRFVLPDLRNHGDAQGLAGPHTLEACVDDLLALTAGQPVEAVVGHSYGGKVCLAYVARRRGELGAAVTVDSNPGARPDARGAEGTVRVVEALAALPPRFASREAFAEAMTRQGFARDLVAWVAMNVVPDGDAWRLRTDVEAVRAMLADYFARDLWDVLERPPGRVRLTAVVGGRSTSLDADDRARLARASGPRLRVDTLDAGHWVHVDAPDETVRVLAEALDTL